LRPEIFAFYKKHGTWESVPREKPRKTTLEQKVIKHSHSPWSAPVFLVSKKMDASNKKKWRLVVDYRKLNEKTIKDKYPMPNINEVLDRIGRAKYFTALDLASGYHQVEMKPEDTEKTLS